MLTSIGPSEARISSLSWKDGDTIDVKAINGVVTYDAAKALREGIANCDCIDRVAFERIDLEARIGVDGQAQAPVGEGFDPEAALLEPMKRFLMSPPVQAVDIEQFSASLVSPFARAVAEGAFSFSAEQGAQISKGRVSAQAGSDSNNLHFEEIDAVLSAQLAPDGTLAIDTDTSVAGVSQRFVNDATGDARVSIRGRLFEDGMPVTAIVDVASLTLELSDAFDPPAVLKDLEIPSVFSLDSAFEISHRSGQIDIQSDEGGQVLSVQSNEKGEAGRSKEVFRLSGRENAPILTMSSDIFALGATAELLDYFPGTVTLEASRSDPGATGKTSLQVDVGSDGGAIDGRTWQDADLSFSGTLDRGRINGDVNVLIDGLASDLEAYKLGMDRIALASRVDINPEASVATATLLEDCIVGGGLSLTSPEQSIDAVIQRATFCSRPGTDQNTLTVEFAGPGLAKPKLVKLAGNLNVIEANAQAGENSGSGNIPTSPVEVLFDPATGSATARGRFSQASVVLNKIWQIGGIAGDWELVSSTDGMRGRAEIDRGLLSQKGDPVMINPMGVRGVATLDGDRITFDYSLLTENNVDIGRGQGQHNISQSAGTTDFTTDALRFSLNGLQPDDFSPLVTGILFDATGGAEGRFRFSWSENGIESEGTVSADAISFRGPTLAVSRTVGVSGDIELTSLLPPTTNGPQSISVEFIDMDALQLT
ncbi:MAG: hypothetical protein AAGA22_07710, partial [Pseudomonadota bacterium]